SPRVSRPLHPLIFLPLLLLSAQLLRAADPIGEFLEKAAVESGATNDQSSDASAPQRDLVAGESEMAALGTALTNETKNLFGDPVIGSPPALRLQGMLLILVIVVG